jgi:hypothetical protein
MGFFELRVVQSGYLNARGFDESFDIGIFWIVWLFSTSLAIG